MKSVADGVRGVRGVRGVYARIGGARPLSGCCTLRTGGALMYYVGGALMYCVRQLNPLFFYSYWFVVTTPTTLRAPCKERRNVETGGRTW